MKSGVWKYFTEFEEKEKDVLVRKTRCNHCRRVYNLTATGSTSRLLRHVDSCYGIKMVKRKSKLMINFQGSNQVDCEVIRESGVYVQMKCREIIAKMIIAHEFPFMFVEYQWFNILMKYNNLLYQRVSKTTIKNDCIKIFESEKEKIKKIFRNFRKLRIFRPRYTLYSDINNCLRVGF
jgi:BED zinc finger